MTDRKILIARDKELRIKIAEAEKRKQPTRELLKEQMDVWTQYRDLYIKHASTNGTPKVEQIGGEIQIWSKIRSNAQKIDLPVDAYDKKIFNLRATIFGKEGARKLFKDN